jgi:hypothetical protein
LWIVTHAGLPGAESLTHPGRHRTSRRPGPDPRRWRVPLDDLPRGDVTLRARAAGHAESQPRLPEGRAVCWIPLAEAGQC